MSRSIRVPAGMSTPTRTAQGWETKIGLTTDEDGFFGRECPQPDCLAFFKLHVDEYAPARQRRRLSCPVCGHTGDDEGFLTRDQDKRVRAGARELAMGAAQAAMDEVFGSAFRSHRSGPVTITYTPASPRTPRPLPSYVERQTVRTFTCPVGGHRAVIYDLLALCPYCGPDTPARAVFDDNLAAMTRLLELGDHLSADHRTEFEAAGGATALAERALTGAVAATQSLAKRLHAQAGKPDPIGNPWQNVERLRKQWLNTFAVDPLDGVPTEQLSTLRLGFARRHVLEHNGGVADAQYVREAGDGLPIGRRVLIRAPFVRRFMDEAALLAFALEAAHRP